MILHSLDIFYNRLLKQLIHKYAGIRLFVQSSVHSNATQWEETQLSFLFPLPACSE